MKPPGDNLTALHRSQRWYRRLLAVYPAAHRAKYEEPMAQLFRDQCRDAWRDAGRRGLLLLWLRTLSDLLKTSFIEHLANLKGKNMADKIATGARTNSAPRTAFVIVFIGIFALVLMTATIITFILPEQYASKARLFVKRQPAGNFEAPWLQSEAEVMKSELILDNVIDELALNEVWQKKYASETKFKTAETRKALKQMIEIQPILNTSIMDITVFSDDKMEAAKIANCLAENYFVYNARMRSTNTMQAIRDVEGEHLSQGKKLNEEDEVARIADIISEVNARTADGAVSVSFLEHAEPSFRAVRPNKPLNIMLGAILATMAGLFAGGIAAFLVSREQRNWGKSPPPVKVIQSKY